MSELYAVAVSNVEDDTVEMTVTIVHPDVYELPTSKTFAFRLLCDPIFDWRLDEHPSVLGSPLKEEVDMDDYLSEEWIGENAGGFVESVELVEAQNNPIPSPWDDREAYDAFWESDEQAVGTYRIRTTHAGWTDHLEAGMEWETASYDSGPAQPWGGAPRTPGDRVWVLAADEEVGFHAAQKRELGAKYFEEYTLEEGFLVPSEGDSYYVADEPVEGDPVDPETIASYLGQPVVIETADDRLVGTLVRHENEEWLGLYNESDGSIGIRGLGEEDVRSIGRAWFRERKPLN